MYMGKKLDYSNLHRLTNFMSDNKGYLAWRKERKRLEKIKEGIEKPFKPLQNLVKQYQAIGERLNFFIFTRTKSIKGYPVKVRKH